MKEGKFFEYRDLPYLLEGNSLIFVIEQNEIMKAMLKLYVPRSIVYQQ